MPVRRRTSKRKPTIADAVARLRAGLPIENNPENELALIEALFFLGRQEELRGDDRARALALIDKWQGR